ncbi:hypothetical protein RRSWK_01763 [Rhodopirellula sp. SWK7]|nr:hypothetical protein RRSWK_01763 [Rhodopirellula sp. SWK7]
MDFHLMSRTQARLYRGPSDRGCDRKANQDGNENGSATFLCCVSVRWLLERWLLECCVLMRVASKGCHG